MEGLHWEHGKVSEITIRRLFYSPFFHKLFTLLHPFFFLFKVFILMSIGIRAVGVVGTPVALLSRSRASREVHVHCCGSVGGRGLTTACRSQKSNNMLSVLGKNYKRQKPVRIAMKNRIAILLGYDPHMNDPLREIKSLLSALSS